VKVGFTPVGWSHFQHWAENDPAMLARVSKLIEAVRRSPFQGIGKPEPLKNELRGWWSRRIDGEHRLVYRVTGSGDEQRVEIAQCRHHY
jgi:toxin YoeB